MDRHAVALVLDEIATLMELHGEGRYRAQAYTGAARALRALERGLDAVVAAGELEDVRGIGPATAGVIRELLEEGASTLHRELRERTPDGLVEMLSIPGLGARRIHTLHDALGVESLDELERAAEEGRVAEVPGFGRRTAEKLLEGIAFLKSAAGHRRQPAADDVAAYVLGLLRDHPAVVRAELAGALRRSLETVAAVDVVAVARDDAAPVLDAFLELPGATRGERVGTAARARLGDGFALRLQCVPPDAFVAAWVHATGDEEHVAALVRRAGERGLRFTEHGLWRGDERLDLEDEAACYRALGLALVPPELREGADDLERAAAGELPRLVTLDDLRGTFHCHTTYSDGKSTLREMAEGAQARGWRYLGIADHSQAAGYANGLTADDVARQHDEIDAWNDEHGDELWLFKGIEADILADGMLDYADRADDLLARFDYVVGSVHSSFGLPESEQTQRLLRALENPHLTFLGHPTGRLLLSRAGYAVDLDAVIDAAGEHGVGIEINANPRRLELDWRRWRRARERGVKTAVNPDAHSVAGLDDVAYGIRVARKGGLAAADVVNARDLAGVKRYLRRGG